MWLKRALALSLVAICSCSLSHAQHIPTFDVVSIKQSEVPFKMMWLKFNPDQLSVKALSVRELLCNAFSGCDQDTFENLPPWCSKTRFDIEAKILKEGGTPLDLLSQPEKRSLIEQILREHFGLRYHHTTKIEPALVLLRNSKVSQVKLPAPKRPLDEVPACLVDGTSEGYLSVDGCTVSEFAHILGRVDGKQVVDQTDIPGRFHLALHWTNELATAPAQPESWPSIYTAVKQQLGLWLQPGRAPFPHMVVDAITIPSPN